jgi:hypothetical protein
MQKYLEYNASFVKQNHKSLYFYIFKYLRYHSPPCRERDFALYISVEFVLVDNERITFVI